MKSPNNKRQKKDVSLGRSLLILILLVGSLLVILSLNASDKPKKLETTQNASHERQQLIDEFAPLYCQKQADVRIPADSYLGQQGWPVRSGTTAWSNTDCQTIIAKLYDTGSTKDDFTRIIEAQTWIGQTQTQLLYSWGAPNSVNTSNYGTGENLQYIYNRGDFRTQYIYIENGKVASYQTF